jgi:hypothetical protein
VTDVRKWLHIIRQHPQMTELDKQNIVSVLAQSPRFAAAVAVVERERERAAGGNSSSSSPSSPAWEQYMSLKGIVACSQKPVPPEKVYKIRGVGEVEGEPEVRSHFFFIGGGGGGGEMRHNLPRSPPPPGRHPSFSLFLNPRPSQKQHPHTPQQQNRSSITS